MTNITAVPLVSIIEAAVRETGLQQNDQPDCILFPKVLKS